MSAELIELGNLLPDETGMPPGQPVLKFRRLLTKRRFETSLVEWSCARVVPGRTQAQETLPYQVFFNPVLQP